LFSQVLEGDKQPLIIKEYVTFAGTAVGLKNWLRMTFAVDPVSLEEALGRVKSFCLRHSKQFERY
jgi:tyrosine aminotransferase